MEASTLYRRWMFTQVEYSSVLLWFAFFVEMMEIFPHIDIAYNQPAWGNGMGKKINEQHSKQLLMNTTHLATEIARFK